MNKATAGSIQRFSVTQKEMKADSLVQEVEMGELQRMAQVSIKLRFNLCRYQFPTVRRSEPRRAGACGPDPKRPDSLHAFVSRWTP